MCLSKKKKGKILKQYCAQMSMEIPISSYANDKFNIII